jgi:DNA-directed RNA polymerase specialized sigma subunit
MKTNHFAHFAESLKQLITGYDVGDEDLTARQKRQVESLVAAEQNFKKKVLNDSRGDKVYKDFIKFILDDEKNILAARPYFRERQGEFSIGIAPAIRERKHKDLAKFDINYCFIVFALNSNTWGPNSKINKAAKEVNRIRKEIIELNMPLAISRAKIFKNKTPESHLEYMDLVQISMEGLINAVDKFVLPYTPVFRSVIIGRCVGDLILSYSETLLHFYPSDKRKIYRANKVKRDKNDTDYEKLADTVNGGVRLESPTSPSEIQQLTTAASAISLNSTISTPDSTRETSLMDELQSDESNRPDVIVERENLIHSLSSAIDELSIFEQKVIRLMGITHWR